MTSAVDVLVVGAGPTGLLLGAELRRRGVACRVIDAHATPLHWDRATVIHPRSLEIFESLGILAPFLAAGVKQRVARLHSDGNVLGEIDLALSGSRHGFNLGLSEEVTESILSEYLHRHGGAVSRGARLTALRGDGASVVVTIEQPGGAETLAARWVVGCDGLHSTTRELSGIALAGHDIAEPWAVFDVTLTGWPESHEANYAYLDAVPVILTALPNRRWRVYLRPRSDEADLVREAAATIGRYHPALAFDAVANPTRFHCHTKVATRFRAGPVLIAGDAAHVCSPAQGHGMNSGLQDAFNLAWKLALVCRGDADAGLLDSYEVERRPVAEAITASGDAAEHAHTLRDPAERRARDLALRAVFADPEARHHEAIAEAELDIDYGSSPIVMGDRHPALSPGQRLPDTIGCQGPSGEARRLEALTHRAGHTALFIAGDSGAGHASRDLAAALAAAAADAVVATDVVALSTDAGLPAQGRLSEDAAQRLGVAGATLLVIRPDGHIGLRADRDHLAAFAAYQTLVRLGGR